MVLLKRADSYLQFPLIVTVSVAPMKNIKHNYFSTLSHIYFFLLHLTISISGISTAPYIPTDNITLDCGSSTVSEAQDGRKWFGDIGSKFGPSEQSNTTSVNLEAPQQPASVIKVPYMTARISRSQFTYTFPVTAGQKFIRLYFYPASYPGFKRSKAFFSVKAGPYTLLSNFSASLTSDSLGSESLFKEFCINVEDNQLLNITFAPSTTTSDNVYAFINGIEIVSMPTNLYYTSTGDIGVPLIGPYFSNENNTALEMVYRLNVGGSYVLPMQDSGMFRTWSRDDDYLLSELGVVLANTNITIKYTNKTPPYTAPEQVYLTARSMGMKKAQNYGYNLTWILPVDSGFNYLVRLHFCELEPEMKNIGDRVFHIYINNQTVEESADVIHWSDGNGIPVYRDYVVMIEGQVIEGKRDLVIALHPQAKSPTAYSDAILNGLEMFKLGYYDGNLAGPNPAPHVVPLEQFGWSANKSKIKKTPFIVVGGGTIIGVTVLSLLGFIVFWRWMKTKSQNTKVPLLSEELCRKFTLAEIQTATKNFDEALVIGHGGFGRVYKGYIVGGYIPVAIKRLKPQSLQGTCEFLTEIEMLSRLHHRHIVSLIGYCIDKRQMILVYDYMAHGTLRDHLYKTENPPLPWKLRLQICIGAARGLEYVHAGAKDAIIHRDIKTTNILLDENWVAKVSDFGLSKMGPTTVSVSHVSTEVKGTFGYLDPEYYWSHRLTEKSDVFAFGVVLFEVLCGRAALDMELEEDQHSLAQWARHCVENGTVDQIIDPYLTGKIAPECLRVFVEIAHKCLHDRRNERPNMGNVVLSLQFALELQESVKTGEAHGEENDGGVEIRCDQEH